MEPKQEELGKSMNAATKAVDQKNNTMELRLDRVAHEGKTFQGEYSRGVNSNGLWYNVRGVQAQVDAFFNPNMLAKGNTVKVKLGAYSTITVESLVKKAENRFGEHSDGDMLNLDMLLDYAHKKGLVAIKTHVITHDIDKKIAIFRAEVFMQTFADDEAKTPFIKEFHGHGDAMPDLSIEYTNKNGDNKVAYNMENGNIKPHYFRMAETRAICRALRWAVNSSSAAKEELGNNDEEGKKKESLE